MLRGSSARARRGDAGVLKCTQAHHARLRACSRTKVHARRLITGRCECVCVCACACVRARVCACVYVRVCLYVCVMWGRQVYTSHTACWLLYLYMCT